MFDKRKLNMSSSLNKDIIIIIIIIIINFNIYKQNKLLTLIIKTLKFH